MSVADLPINLSDEHVEEYRELCRKHLNLEVSKEDAREQATKLVQLMAIIGRPIPKEDKK